MPGWVHAVGFLLAMVLSAFSSMTETSFYRASRVRLRVRQERGGSREGLALRLLDRLDSVVTTILITNNIAAYAGTYFLTIQLVRWRVPQAELAATLILSPTIFIFGESLPKQIAYNHADILAPALAGTLDFLRRLFKPVIWVLNSASALIRSLLGIKGGVEIAPSERAKLVESFAAGVAENFLTEDQRSMANSIMELERINASGIMIPTAQLLQAPERTSRAKAVEKMAAADAQMLVLTGGNGRLTGKVITINNLIRNPGRPEESIANLAVDMGRIKSGASLSEVLLWLKREHAQRVAVTERGRITGVITTKSLLDSIAGM